MDPSDISSPSPRQRAQLEVDQLLTGSDVSLAANRPLAVQRHGDDVDMSIASHGFRCRREVSSSAANLWLNRWAAQKSDPHVASGTLRSGGSSGRVVQRLGSSGGNPSVGELPQVRGRLPRHGPPQRTSSSSSSAAGSPLSLVPPNELLLRAELASSAGVEQRGEGIVKERNKEGLDAVLPRSSRTRLGSLAKAGVGSVGHGGQQSQRGAVVLSIVEPSRASASGEAAGDSTKEGKGGGLAVVEVGREQSAVEGGIEGEALTHTEGDGGKAVEGTEEKGSVLGKQSHEVPFLSDLKLLESESCDSNIYAPFSQKLGTSPRSQTKKEGGSHSPCGYSPPDLFPLHGSTRMRASSFVLPSPLDESSLSPQEAGLVAYGARGGVDLPRDEMSLEGEIARRDGGQAEDLKEKPSALRQTAERKPLSATQGSFHAFMSTIVARDGRKSNHPTSPRGNP